MHSVIRTEVFTKVFVITNKNERFSIVPIVIYGSKKDGEYKRGQSVKFVGGVQIKRCITNDGTKQYYQNYVAAG